MRILVTGRAGSGKSAVAIELKRRGFNAFDTDQIEGLSAWYKKSNGKKVQVSNNQYVSEDLEWLWNGSVLEELCKANQDIFVCGGADNDFEFEAFFDRHFVLNVSPQVQVRRLSSRQNNDYGRDPAMHERIVAQQEEQVKNGMERGAVIVDADQPIQNVVDEILKVIV